ncbi:MAG TPA: RND transporter, partial [Syntrophobacteraceae bacterium]|nr:RND transporter [Syntrophobacteraceae bacterium]
MRKYLLVVMLALMIGSCTVGPDYKRPAIDIPAAWRVSDKEAGDLAQTAWWEQFNDPILTNLITVALQENKDLLIAAA